MSEEALAWLKELLSGIGISYAFGFWLKEPAPDPYWVGEKSEDPPESEDGLQECSILLTGTGTSLYRLEQDRERIRTLHESRGILKNGSGVALFYDGSFPVPVDQPGLQRLQVDLLMKEWRI